MTLYEFIGYMQDDQEIRIEVVKQDNSVLVKLQDYRPTPTQGIQLRFVLDKTNETEIVNALIEALHSLNKQVRRRRVKIDG